jgi:hypothetical protein
LLSQVKYAGYDVRVKFLAQNLAVKDATFSMEYGDTTETVYLVGFKYFWISLSVVLAIVYYVVLSEIPADERTVEQNFIQMLTVLLVFFNDPLYLAGTTCIRTPPLRSA